ncbi:MAG: UDP-glucose 4-epimerase GalE [Bacteroidetes bacterium]|nr:UDP-glucose 4-epimerase GalE [Bacteroidota bacterium]
MSDKLKILVTGGNGFIGSHTVVELLHAGYNPVIADNFSNSSPGIVENIERITGKRPAFSETDICSESETQKLFLEHGPFDAVIHFAAFKAVGESMEKPLMYYHNNIGSLISLIRVMQQNQVSKLVFSSSCTVYGQPDILPVTEKTPLKSAASPYGKTKQLCEEIINDVCTVEKLDAVSLRYFNPAGAHESALIGELPLGIPNNLVPFIMQTAIGKREVLNVFGGDYNTPDGTAIRDYIHVVDVAKAHVSALQRLYSQHSHNGNEIFNLGTGKGNSVLEAINSFEKTSGTKLNYKIVARRSGDIEKVWADTSMANKELGWKTELDIDDIMRSAWNWEKYLASNV